eukprot:29729-Pelagococcus_subviridis.AAC.5
MRRDRTRTRTIDRSIHPPLLHVVGGASDEEEDAEGDRGPRRDREDAGDLDPDEIAAAAQHEAVVFVTEELFLREQADGEAPPHAARAVNGERLQRIVDPELEEKLRGAAKDERGDEGREDRPMRVHHVAARGDGHEAGEDAVAHGDEVPHLVEGAVKEQGRDAAGRGGERGHDRGSPHLFRGGEVVERVYGPRVEPVPSDPQHESAEDGERGVVPGHRDRLAVHPEAAGSGTEHDRAHETGEPADHVDDAGSGEVDEADAAPLGGVERGDPTVR